MTQYRIGLLAFPAMTQLDMTGPLQVFANLPGADVRVIWKTLDPIQTQGGLRLLPDTTLDDCPKLDVICVPGGYGVMELMADPVVLSFLRAQGGRGDLCRIDLHRITGAGRGRVAARTQGDHALGLDRSAGAVRRRSDQGPCGARRQVLHRRRGNRRDRLRVDHGGRTCRPGSRREPSSWGSNTPLPRRSTPAVPTPHAPNSSQRSARG